MINKLLPKLLVISLPARYKVLRKLYNSKNLENSLANLKAENNTDTILIVGNGPSLNNSELSKFNCFSIGMNKIHLIFDRTSWRPNVVVVNNGLVLKQLRQVITRSSIPYYLSFKAFFLGLKGRNVSFFLESFTSRFTEDFTQYVGTSSTVTYSAMQLAVHLEPKKIILVGIDHNFGQVNEVAQNRIERFKGDDHYHFDKNYFKGHVWGTPDLSASEKGYKLFADICHKKGIKVYDATVGGKLNLFTKISIEEALKIIGRSFS